MNLKALLTNLLKEDTPDEEERADAPQIARVTSAHGLQNAEDSEKAGIDAGAAARSDDPTGEDDEDSEHDEDQEYDDSLPMVALNDQQEARTWGPRRIFTRVLSSIFPSPSDEEEIQAYIPHYRILPILSGIAIPFSILLDIPGLTADWYARTNGTTVVASKPNPPLLDVGVALSLLCAVLANLCLVIRFLERRVKTMTILCIVFLSIHGKLTLIFPCRDPIMTFRYDQRCCSCCIRINEGRLLVQPGILADTVLYDCVHIHERDPHH